jgi:hypothetical protein
MPAKGRKRLTQDDLEARIAAYCRRHGITPTRQELPPFPSGKRETAQHREWLGLYKLHNRLGRRARGQCERCASPASAGSVFCDAHRGGVAARAGDDAATLEARQRLLAVQRERCPVCRNEVALGDSLDQDPGDGQPRGLLHQGCSQLVGLAEARGPEVLERLRAYLWPRRVRRSS